MSNFDLELFLQELKQHLRDAELQKNDSVNEQFDKFCATFNSVVNKIAPLRKASRKEKRLRAKPWLTKGLLKSIKRKHALFSKLLKALHSDGELNNYKRYRNVLNRVIKSGKESYYRESFYQNKNDQEKLWKVINELAFIKKKKKVIPSELISDDKIVQDPQSICEIMNNFFVNVGKTLADKIQPVTNKPSSFHNNLPRIKHSFFFSPASSDEIATIIRSLKPKKSNRENNIETKFLKYSNVIISPVICNIFNSCIEQGKFPDSLKIAKVVPIFKKGDSNQVSTGQFPYYHNLAKFLKS